MASKTSCVEIFNGKRLEDHYQILVNPEFIPALLVGEEEELGVGPVNAILSTNEWFAVERRVGVLAPDFSDGG